jgi:50S ribosomal protein L16 3-hydroxylase
MLEGWLGGVSVESFVASTLGAWPTAAPGTAAEALGAVDWGTLDRVLASARKPDVLVVARGQLLPVPAPRSLSEARALLLAGIGFVVRFAERHDAAIAALTAALERDLPGTAHAQLFITPGGSHGFGWHYDWEDVFVAQTDGVKDYYFRANTVDRTAPGDRPDFRRFRAETSPLATARLVPGDFLYIPAMWWHMARCVETSLSISIGHVPAHGVRRDERA